LEIQSYIPTFDANDNRLQQAFPVIGAVNVAGAQGIPVKVTELVEQEQVSLRDGSCINRTGA
jgi:hypothetical protein